MGSTLSDLFVCLFVCLFTCFVTNIFLGLPPVLDLNTDSSLLQDAFVDFLERDGSKTRIVQGTNQLITDPDSTVIQLITVELFQRPDETTGFERLQLDQSALSETVVMLINSKTYVSGRLTIIGRFSSVIRTITWGHVTYTDYWGVLLLYIRWDL